MNRKPIRRTRNTDRVDPQPTYQQGSQQSNDPLLAALGVISGVTSSDSSGRRVTPTDNTISRLLQGRSGFSQILGQLGENTNPNDSDFLQQLLGTGLGLDSKVGTDYDTIMSKLVEMYLQNMIAQEQRNYDKGALNEQRIYDSPTNQLARLMGAGISRDAAIQLLSGGSDAGLVGSGADAAAPAGIDKGAQAVSIANTVFGIISGIAGAIGSLGQFGMSAASLSTNIAATKAATAGQILSNTQLSKTLAGIETASTVVGAISSAYQSGIISKDHNFESSQDMLKFISDNADKYEPFGALKSSGALDGIQRDVYSLDALNHAYQSWRETRDFNVDRSHIVRMQALDEMFKDVDVKRVQQEIAESGQRINESIQNVLNSVRLTDAQVVALNSQANLADLQSDIAYINREMQQSDLDWMNANVSDINSVRTNQLMLDAACWSQYSSNPELLTKEVTSWLQNKDNLRTAIAIESFYYANRAQAIDALQQDAPPLSDTNFAQMACWFHNLFAQTALPRTPNQHESSVLGNLDGSSVALWALRKYAHIP